MNNDYFAVKSDGKGGYTIIEKPGSWIAVRGDRYITNKEDSNTVRKKAYKTVLNREKPYMYYMIWNINDNKKTDELDRRHL